MRDCNRHPFIWGPVLFMDPSKPLPSSVASSLLCCDFDVLLFVLFLERILGEVIELSHTHWIAKDDAYFLQRFALRLRCVSLN
jgi:hypothetical protein